MAGHGEKLSRKQEQAIAALLSEPTIPEAAKSAGIGERTLWRWLKLEGFKDSYREARREVVRQAVALVQAGMGTAVRTLSEIMENTESPASSRVAAARAMIDLGVKAVELEDLDARLSGLEKLINEQRKGRGKCV